MAKYYGAVGYAVAVETAPGVWTDQIIERPYKGEVIRRVSRWQNSGQVNDNLDVSNEISILADPYAYQNFSRIKYVQYMNALWKVTSIEVQRPRLILSIGGVWNGQQD